MGGEIITHLILSAHSQFRRSMKIEQWLEAFQMFCGLSLESDFSGIPFLFSPLPFFELSLCNNNNKTVRTPRHVCSGVPAWRERQRDDTFSFPFLRCQPPAVPPGGRRRAMQTAPQPTLPPIITAQGGAQAICLANAKRSHVAAFENRSRFV